MYLSVSKEAYWEAYSNQDKWKKKQDLKKTRCRCNGKLILLCLLIFKSFIFCFIHIV